MKQNELTDLPRGVTTDTPKKHYEAPSIIESPEMTFTKNIWEDFSEGNWCFGCTNCNCN
jgi:hypothetical protein